MQKLIQRGLSFAIILALCIGMLSGAVFTVSADTYVYNWGQRGTLATSLSDSAVAFYAQQGAEYDYMAALAGASATEDVPSSELYLYLQELMTEAHTYINNYDASRDFFAYTDCENGGGKISSFYSGTAIGPAWDSGITWNREHTWPDSKGMNGRDEDDIMMLRPTAVNENNDRKNTAYGESSSYYDPNSVSGGTYNLHGDVARIALYVYVRWGNTGNMWGTSGVIESLDVLLDWMEEDPVDTWEMGRNDAVESITGTRNVFVDYPELAFDLFEVAVPEHYDTPSGSVACSHTNLTTTVTEATCTEDGLQTDVCQTCGKTIYTVLPATGHNWENGSCANCGEVMPVYEIRFVTPAGVAPIATQQVNDATAVVLPQADVPTGEYDYSFIGWSTAPIDHVLAENNTVTILEAGTSMLFQQDTVFYAVYAYTKTAGGSEISKTVAFEFGSNGGASHVDGNDLGTSKSYTSDGYTLALTDMSKVFGPAYDAKGNSCIKLGSSKVIGSFSFTAPDDVSSVVISVAKYKANTTKISVNGTSYTLATNSNDGSYTDITVDTSTTKTVSFTTVSGGVRCMINTITYQIAGGEAQFITTGLADACAHSSTRTETVPSTATQQGYEMTVCDSCGATLSYHELPLAVEFQFHKVSLEIGQGLSVNFKAPKTLFTQLGYSEPTATFSLNGHTFTATGADNGDGTYVFRLYDIRPDWLGDDITATLSAQYEGQTVSAKPITYNVKSDYCMSKLNSDESSQALKTLLVDILNYSAASQLYTGHNTDNLANAALTDAQKALATAYTDAQSQRQISQDFQQPQAAFQNVALYLREVPRIRVGFTCDAQGVLCLEGQVGDTIHTMESDSFTTSGNVHYAFFDHVMAYQMRTPVSFTVCADESPVSQTLTYSIQSYVAYAVSSSQDQNLVDMLKAMLSYGDSVSAYIETIA